MKSKTDPLINQLYNHHSELEEGWSQVVADVYFGEQPVYKG